MKRPSISILFDSRNMPEGRYSVKWHVYYSGKQKAYSTGEILDKEDVKFLKANKEFLSGRIKDDAKRNLWNMIYGDEYTDTISGVRKESVTAKGKRVLAQIEDYFTFEIFAQTIAGNYNPEDKTPTNADIIKALENRGQKLIQQGDASNGNLHLSTASSLRRYAVYAKLAKSVESVELPIMAITQNFLRNYEKWMLQFGKAPKNPDNPAKPASISTASIYCRYIRILWNEAIDSGIVSKENYPFKTAHKSGFKLASVLNTKKAISEEILLKLFQYEAPVSGSPREMWKDLWLFIYMANGINTMDLCKLKNEDLDYGTNTISFYRDKTIDTKRTDMRKIVIEVLPEIKEILEKWRNTDRSPGARLFPFLPGDVSADREKRIVNQVTKNINTHMNRIAKELELGIKINTYQARHTFATTMATANAPLKYITQKFGHGSMKTTEKYIGSIEGKTTESYLSNLVPKDPKTKQ